MLTRVSRLAGQSPSTTKYFQNDIGQLTEVSDSAGNVLTYTYDAAGNIISITRGPAPGANTLAILNFTPQIGGIGATVTIQGQIPINAHLVVSFSEPVDAESLNGVTLSTNGLAVPLTEMLGSGNQLLTLIPANGLEPNTAYKLTVAGVTDLSGNAMTVPATSGFTTGAGPDLSKPAVVTVTPNASAVDVPVASVVTIQFSKLMNPLLITNSSFTLTTNGNTFVAGTITFNVNGSQAVFTPSTELSPSTTYSLQLTGSVLDLEGQPIVAFNSTFTTGTE